MSEVFEYLFFETIYGAFILAAGVFYLLKPLKNRIGETFQYAITGLVWVLCISTLPSIPRFQFEEESYNLASQYPHMKLVHTTSNGAVAEPITWFMAPVGFFRFIGPEPSLTSGEFREIILRYEQDPVIRFYKTFCEDREFSVAMADNKGVLRIVSPEWEKMTDSDFELFCIYDWKKEKRALRELSLKQ